MASALAKVRRAQMAERLAAAAQLRSRGHTLAAIGRELGASRERARTMLERWELICRCGVARWVERGPQALREVG